MTRFALLALLLAAAPPARAAPEAAQTYTCDDGSRMSVAFDAGADKMIVERSGTNYVLAHLLSADGVRFGDARLEFWGRGRSARVTDRATGVAVACETR